MSASARGSSSEMKEVMIRKQKCNVAQAGARSIPETRSISRQSPLCNCCHGSEDRVCRRVRGAWRHGA